MVTYRPEAQPCTVMPLGGIGTGNVAIGADGGLRQWQLHNLPNHLGDLPYAFFAVRLCRMEPPLDEVRIVQAAAVASPRPATPMVNDQVIPLWQRDLVERVGGFTEVTMEALYPRAVLEFNEPAWPLGLRLEAVSPFAPGDVAASSVPGVVFACDLVNRGDQPIHGWLGGTLPGAVGADGAVNPDGVRHPGYGGNTMRVRRLRDAAGATRTRLIAENPALTRDDPRAGQMVLAVDAGDVRAFPTWTEPEQFVQFMRTGTIWRTQPGSAADRRDDPAGVTMALPAGGPSAPGRTWCGGLVAPFALGAGEARRITFALSWHFPNRYVNFENFGPPHPEWGASRFWLGNAYATCFADAEAVDDHLARWAEGGSAGRRPVDEWCDLWHRASLPDGFAEHLSAQAVVPRSPTCFVDGQGRLFGFEGGLGASTGMWGGTVGGSCPLNCTHVWNYEHALAYLWPDLERSLRETEWEVMQAPDGSIPHRVVAPTYLPQPRGDFIGGPERPALDGMLGAVLKTYREARAGGGAGLVARYWPGLERLACHIEAQWDPGGTGVLRGIQPCTYDIDLVGVNPYIGGLWLAALRAWEEMAALQGDAARRQWARERFAAGRAAYEAACWNGEYYQQAAEPEAAVAEAGIPFQWGEGCLTDQLIGQWWAHELGLGHILPAAHVRQAAAAIVRHNLRSGFDGFEHASRPFAVGDEAGTVLVTWPRGGRPDVPLRYADEVWTGSEYALAALCLREGLTEPGLAVAGAVWARYDGRRRNPFNEVECGDHYVRSLAGWTLLRAATGIDYNAIDQTMRVSPAPGLGLDAADGAACLPFFEGGAWGWVTLADGTAHVHVVAGELPLRRVLYRPYTSS
jgi:hypothetical protein